MTMLKMVYVIRALCMCDDFVALLKSLKSIESEIFLMQSNFDIIPNSLRSFHVSQKKLRNILNIENTWLDIKCANILHRFILVLSKIRNNITPVK